MKTSIMVAVLSGSERHFWIHPNLMLALVRMPLWQMETGSALSVSTIMGCTPVAAARNHAVENMLNMGIEWLLQIDNDTVPPPNLLQVLDHVGDRKIVGFPTPMEYEDGKTCFNLGKIVGSNSSELQKSIPAGWSKVDAVGSGCLLVHRDVFRALSDPWFEHSAEQVKKMRIYAGEDFHFCEKAREKGFEVWINSDFICRHYHTVDLYKVMSEVPQALEKYHQGLSSALGHTMPTPRDLNLKF
ncbi:MAG: hypothetical protein ACJ71W_16570 [Terriglobales bacterium]